MLSDTLYPDAQRFKVLLGLMLDRVKKDEMRETRSSLERVAENIPSPCSQRTSTASVRYCRADSTRRYLGDICQGLLGQIHGRN